MRAPAKLGLRNRLAGLWLRAINPFARRMIPAGIPTGAPNVLLTVPGRRTGMPRTVPLGIVVLDDRTFVQASFGEAGWVANVRAGCEATVTYPGGHSRPVEAIELPPEEGGSRSSACARALPSLAVAWCAARAPVQAPDRRALADPSPDR